MSSFRRSSQPRSPTLQADSLLAGLPGKPLVYILFVYTLIQKTLIEKVEFYWPSYLCNHGSRLCVSLLLSFHFLRSKSQCSGFSAWRLTRTDCDTSQAIRPCPAFALQEAEEQLLGGHQSMCLGWWEPFAVWPTPLGQCPGSKWPLDSTSWLPAPRGIERSWVARVKAVKSRKPGFCLKFQNVWLWGLCQISSAIFSETRAPPTWKD